MSESQDRDLGMNRRISRRDFINGMAITAGAALVPPHLWATFGDHISLSRSEFARLLSARSHWSSWKSSRVIRSCTAFAMATSGKRQASHSKPAKLYDLVIVGGGISGLSAAHYFRKAVGEKARVLILDNHDDFGGHAKRNEFHRDGNMRLGFGGTFSIESPSPYSAVAKAMITELGSMSHLMRNTSRGICTNHSA